MIKRNTREILVESALEVIWQKSYNAVSVDEICKQTGVKKGSFYHYFESKVALVIAAMDECFESFIPIMNEVFSASKTPENRFSDFCDLIIAKQKETKEKYGHVCGCPFASLGSEMAGQEDQITQKIAEFIEKEKRFYIAAIRDLIDEGKLDNNVDPVLMADEIYNYILGNVAVAKIENSTEGLEENFCNGLFNLIGIKNKN